MRVGLTINSCWGIVEVATLTTPELLRRVPLFEHLSEVQATALLTALEKKRYRRSEPIVEVGKTSNALFIILAGRANVVITSNFKKIVLATVEAGECVGEMSLLDGKPHSATVVADSQVDALVLSREGFNQCFADNQHLALAIMRGLVVRLRNANQKIASLALTGVSSRVLGYLFSTATISSDGSFLLHKKISNSAIGRQVGASREMVSKAMAEFKTAQLIYLTEGGFSH